MSTNEDLDLSFLYEIADGSDEFIVESVGMFLQQTPELIDSIESAIAQSDWPTAAAAAHKLKPNLGFFGMLNSESLLQEIESMSKAGGQDPDAIRTKFTQAKQMLGQNLVALEKIKQEKETGL
ncbi:hypothetical protein DJ568_00745 [Mucilaginibacter hurinus]|uniref:HPt domain-containing protein n=1 Tax=Mucilaginibacter hurinus TaxID=2201324 RepID=A0A367GT33_9SPHI|nr:Hpt domain-containing protein [Mucilaginibacter hurinus]RCH56420.1 hypothetical protein DJ568_00745 [Mucilaginibacter hurinus]